MTKSQVDKQLEQLELDMRLKTTQQSCNCKHGGDCGGDCETLDDAAAIEANQVYTGDFYQELNAYRALIASMLARVTMSATRLRNLAKAGNIPISNEYLCQQIDRLTLLETLVSQQVVEAKWLKPKEEEHRG